MKLCASPNDTRCVYQRIARDQADPDDIDNGAQAGASSDAFEKLYQFLQEHLDPNDLGEADALLRQFIDKSGDNNSVAMDSRGVLPMAEMRRRVAVGAQMRARETIAQTAALEKRFPNAGRIRRA